MASSSGAVRMIPPETNGAPGNRQVRVPSRHQRRPSPGSGPAPSAWATMRRRRVHPAGQEGPGMPPPPPDHVTTVPTTVRAAGAVVWRRDGAEWRVALVRRSRHGSAEWSLPKGHVEDGETPEDAAR